MAVTYTKHKITYKTYIKTFLNLLLTTFPTQRLLNISISLYNCYKLFKSRDTP